MKKDTIFIGGEWMPSAGNRTVDVISPHTEEAIATVPDETDIDRAEAAARRAFEEGPWPQTSSKERAEIGPVLSVIPYDSEDDAVQIANDTPYGLSGSVAAGDADHAVAIAKRARTGTLAINSGAFIDLENPFGGFKKSGLAREMGPEGLEAYLEMQTRILPPAV